jgi:hypothetical protein
MKKDELATINDRIPQYNPVTQGRGQSDQEGTEKKPETAQEQSRI